MIFGDESEIEQVILNLFVNAADALKENGEIKISFDIIDENVVLKIQDNGIGISEENLDKIFSPFYTNKENDKGTGLGLYIVQNICKNHNADIQCSSKINFGTTFKITFLRGKND